MNHRAVDSLARLPGSPLDEATSDVSRRAFIGLSVSAAGALLFGCSSSKSPSASPDGGMDDAPFGIWEALRTAVRASPDHLGATADRLVAAKDPQAICEFVRDQIATYPPDAGGDPLTSMRWGVRGALRGGAGTPREKAELLVSLYQRAGFDARVVTGNATTTNVTSGVAGDVYLRTITREFAPAVDDATLARWQSELSAIGQVPAPRPIDADDSERSALVASVAALLPSDAAASIGSYEATLATASLGAIPLVAVTVAGQVKYANPLLPGTPFGMSGTDETPTDAPRAAAAPTVAVELFISTTVDPLKRISVAQGTYAAEDLAGRQILVRFAPATDIDTLAKLRIADIHAFRPLLSVRGLDVDPDAQASFVTVGPTITTRGDVIDTLPDGTVTIGGKPLLASKDIDPTAAARVASLAFEVRAGAFPTVELVVEALDSAGNAVTGLPASAFQVLESAQPLGFLESGTPSSKLRVLLAFDLDDPLGSGEDPLAFAEALTTAVVAAYPDAVMVTGEPLMFVESTDPAAVALGASTSNATGDADNPWQLLADAAAEAPTLTVIVSDFIDFTDPHDPTARPRKAFLDIVASGPPIVGIDTAPPPASGSPIVDQVIALTGGVYAVGVGIADGVKAVLDLLAQQKVGGTYTLRYSAPVAGPSQRQVAVSVGKNSATGSYSVPAADTAAQPVTLAGLYLSVSLGDASVTRVLGGYPSTITPPADGERLSQAVLDDVTNGLFGATLLSFEAAAPPLSTLLDDQLSLKLSAKPLHQAVVAQDSKAIRAALSSLGPYVPVELTRLHCALPDNSASSATYENGLRVVAYSNRPRFGVGQERRVDILPLADWGSLAADAATSFQDTLARTARVAIVEGHTYTNNTLTALAGKKLSLLSEEHVDPSTLPYAPEVAARASELLAQYEGFNGYYRLLPEGEAFVGFWAVHRQTGTLLGVLPDGSGGASASDPCSQLSDINNAFDALGLLAEMAEMGALGPFFLIGKEVAAVALLSAALLGDQDGTLNGKDPNAAIDGLAANAGCEAMKLGVLNSLPGKFGSIINKADAIGSVAGATPNCPNALSGVGCK